MITALPVDYGYAVYTTVPDMPVPSVDAWMMVPDVARILQVSHEEYDTLRSQAQLVWEYRRHGYVVAQQNLRGVRPSFNDPQLMREQVQLLAESM